MRRRALRFVLATVAVPVAGFVAVEAADALERRNGSTRLSRGIRSGASMLSRRRR